jgi:hypothetical protein
MLGVWVPLIVMVLICVVLDTSRQTEAMIGLAPDCIFHS